MAVRSIATIDKPEFINITPYNPLISKCEIKVLYIGENRNKSYITKEIAKEMANSLPGNPIVGYFKTDKQDFGDHGDQIVIDDSGLHFNCLTRPYGFVAPDAKVWFQKFQETDDFGRTILREYLMTTGYLWTGQYPECQSVIDEGKGQSMELDEDTLDGRWAKNYKNGMDFFIINDAIFSKLCILGDDVEPCFEGASVSSPDISNTFTKVDDAFKKTLFTMMEELKFTLKGEQKMVEQFNPTQDKIEQEKTVESEIAIEETVDTSFAASDKKKEEEEKSAEAKEEKTESEAPAKEDEDEEKKKYAKADDEEKEKEEKVEDKKEESSEDKDKEDEEEKKKYALLEQNYSELQEKYSTLETQYNELLQFKNQIENEKKDTLINSFYMLSDEDKKDVIENKSKYSLDEIEAKLSVICVRNRVSFDLDKENESEDNKVESPVTTFNLNEQASSAPAWIAALRNTQNSRNI